MKNSLFFLLTLSLMSSSLAQSSLEIETDPIAWAVGGGSFHVALAQSQQRFQIGYAFLELPAGLAQFEGLTESFQTISLKWDYFPFAETQAKGWFFGPTLDLMRWKYENEQDALNQNALNMGLRTGFKFHPFPNKQFLDGLYLTPWAGLSYKTGDRDIRVGDLSYSLNPIAPFITVHLGYQF